MYEAINKEYLLGIRKEDERRIWLTMPEWSCSWYWSFGYLGNKDEHYHLDGYQTKHHTFTTDKGEFKHIREKRNICMYDALKEDYVLQEHIYKNLWTFCELSLAIYALKASAELFHIGGSHMTANPCKHLIRDKAKEDNINKEVLPALFVELEKLLRGEL